MRYWETSHSIPLPWVDMACGYWWRYPNPQSQHVFSVDTLETRVDGDKLYAKRLIMKTNPLPSWGKHFFAARRVAVIEEVVVDRKKQELVWYTRNIALGMFMATVERVTLYPSDTVNTIAAASAPSVRVDGLDTGVTKQCWIDSSILGFRSAIKKFGVDRYKKNCGPATLGFQGVVEEKLARDSLAMLRLSEPSIQSTCEPDARLVPGPVHQTSKSVGSGEIYQAVKRSLYEPRQDIT